MSRVHWAVRTLVVCSVAESDSFDAESGFDEQEVSEAGTDVVRFVTRFIDKVSAAFSDEINLIVARNPKRKL